MNKRKILFFIIAAIFVLGIAGSLWVIFSEHGDNVIVTQDGTVLYTFDLQMAENQTIEVKYEGRHNTIQIEDGKIRLSAADCPDHTCVNRGWMGQSALCRLAYFTLKEVLPR